MLGKMKIASLAVVALCLAGMPAMAQGLGGNASITSSGSTANVQIPLPATKSQFPSVIIAPATGTSAEVFYKMGTDNTVAAVSGTSPSLPSGGICLNLGPNTWIAAISSSATVRITQISGCTQFAGGGGGGGGGGGSITGNVGGYDTAVAVTPTVQNAAYVAGNAMGGLQTVSFFRTAGGSAKLNNISMWSKSGSLINTTFYIFNSNPSASTCTDKVAFVLGAADVSKLITVTPPVLVPHIVGTGTTATADSWQTPVSITNADSTTNIYVCAIVGGPVTPPTTTDYVYKFAGPQD